MCAERARKLTRAPQSLKSQETQLRSIRAHVAELMSLPSVADNAMLEPMATIIQCGTLPFPFPPFENPTRFTPM